MVDQPTLMQRKLMHCVGSLEKGVGFFPREMTGDMIVQGIANIAISWIKVY